MLLIILASLLNAATDAGAGEELALVEKSQLSDGEFTRLHHVMAKARRGEPIVVGVIGGSITAGAGASKPELRYGNLVADWWKKAFPKSKATFVNAGVGATGSNFGAVRIGRDLLSHHPDFVIEEWGVNDGNDHAFAETMEGCTRQILKQANQPAILLLYFTNNTGNNTQEWEGKVGRHYGLPMVSYRDVFWPEIEAKRLKWEDVTADIIHPNDRGHAAAAQFVGHMLDKALRSLPADEKLPEIASIPKPLFTDLFEYTAIHNAGDLKPLSNKGWTYDKASDAWISREPGSAIEFQAEGKLLTLMFFRLRAGFGKAKVQLDDREPVILDGWFAATWGGYREIKVLGRDLPAGMHHVRVELLEEKSPESTGHEFRIFGIGAAGLGA